MSKRSVNIVTTSHVVGAAVALVAFAEGGCIVPPGSSGPIPVAGGQRLPDGEVRPLREAAASAQRHVGTAAAVAHLHDATYKKLAALHFDSPPTGS